MVDRSRRMSRRKRVALGGVLLIIVIMSAVTYKVRAYYRREAAISDVREAWTVAGGAGRLDPREYERLKVPLAYRDRDSVAVYLFLRSADSVPLAAGPAYNLGVFFLTSDCDAARYYLGLHVNSKWSSPDAKELLDRATRDGCLEAYRWLAMRQSKILDDMARAHEKATTN